MKFQFIFDYDEIQGLSFEIIDACFLKKNPSFQKTWFRNFYIINSLRELILSYWIYDKFEYKIFKFIDIKFINIIFQYKLLKSHVKDRDSSSSKRYTYYMRYILEVDLWNESLDSCEYKDI